MLSEEQLNELADLAAVIMPVNDIAIILGCETNELKDLINNDQSAEHKAYYKGKLKAKAELNKSQIQLAKQGSQAAASLCAKLIIQQENSERP
jgi:hypothetical protein